MKKFNILLLFAVLAAYFVNAQAPVIQWQKTYGGTLSDDGGSILQTTDGGYIFAGRTNSNDVDVTLNHGGSDWWVVKTDNLGNIQWQKSLGGSSDDILYHIIQTADGGYAAAGWTLSNDGDVTNYQGNKDCWVVKLSSTGSIEWQKTLGGSSEEEFRFITQTSDGGYACSGWTFSNDGDVSGLHGFRDAWMVRLDSGGNLVWQKCYGGTNDDLGYTVRQTTDYGYIFAAHSQSSNGDVTNHIGLRDYWLVKTDSVGTISWQKTLGGTDQEDMRGAIQTSDGGYIATGYTRSSDGNVSGYNGNTDMWVVKVDGSGNFQWQNSLGGTDVDKGSSIAQTSDGGYAISGYTSSNDGDVTGHQNLEDCWLVKLSSTGTLDWQKTFGGTGQDAGGEVALINNGYIVAGVTNSNDGDVTNNKGSEDLWVVKLLHECAPGTVTADLSGEYSICSGNSVNLTINFTGTAPWIYSVNGGPLQYSSNATTTFSVSPLVNTTYAVTSVGDNECPSGTITGPANVLVSTAPPLNTVRFLTVETSGCSGSVGFFTCKVVTGQNIRYRWFAPAGTQFSTLPGGPFVAGPFETSAPQVYIQYGALSTGISGYSICVEGFNGCGTTNQKCTWVRGTVSTPGNIVGDKPACPSSTKTYSTTVPVGTDILTWTFSVPGAVITPLNPIGSSVSVTFPSSYTTGDLCVTASLACGGSSVSPPRCQTITAVPSAPGAISGANSACGGTSGTYSVPPVSGATTYTWTFNYPGALINGNASPYTSASNSVTVSFPAGYGGNASLCVAANNDCNSSGSRCQSIRNLIPAQPGAITANPTTWCSNSSVTFSVAPVAGATSYNWTLSNGAINNGQGTNSIDATWGTGNGNVAVTASNSCGTSAPKVLAASSNCRESAVSKSDAFMVYPNPASENIQVNFASSGSKFQIQIMDLSGRIVYSMNEQSSGSYINKTISLNTISKGMYFLEMTQDGNSRKVMIAVE